jgi:hypothetical protein
MNFPKIKWELFFGRGEVKGQMLCSSSHQSTATLHTSVTSPYCCYLGPTSHVRRSIILQVEETGAGRGIHPQKQKREKKKIQTGEEIFLTISLATAPIRFFLPFPLPLPLCRRLAASQSSVVAPKFQSIYKNK